MNNDAQPVDLRQPRGTPPPDHPTRLGDACLIGTTQASVMLGIGRTKLYDLIAVGSIKPVKIGRKTLFRRDELQRYIEHLPRLELKAGTVDGIVS